MQGLGGFVAGVGVYMSVTCPQKRLENLHEYGCVCTGTV